MTLKKGWLGRQLNHVSNDVQAWPEWMRREAGFGEYRVRQSEPVQQAAQREEPREPRTATARPGSEG